LVYLMFIFDKNTKFIGGTFSIDPSKGQGVQNTHIQRASGDVS